MKRFSVVGGQWSVVSHRKFFLAVFFLLFTFHFSLFTVKGQDEQRDVAPPPLKVISKEEKKQLEAEADNTKRTKLALLLMDARLKAAENFFSKQQYREMFDELGGFHALADKTLDFLNRNNDGRGKSLGNFKRFEISLRTFLPRLEIIRRELPAEYEPYVRDLSKSVRLARAKAVEPFFGNTVVEDN